MEHFLKRKSSHSANIAERAVLGFQFLILAYNKADCATKHHTFVLLCGESAQIAINAQRAVMGFACHAVVCISSVAWYMACIPVHSDAIVSPHRAATSVTEFKGTICVCTCGYK